MHRQVCQCQAACAVRDVKLRHVLGLLDKVLCWARVGTQKWNVNMGPYGQFTSGDWDAKVWRYNVAAMTARIEEATWVR